MGEYRAGIVSPMSHFPHHHRRHCEPTGRANARPMTGSAKPSIFPLAEVMDCFVAVAPLRKRFAFVADNDGGETLRFNGVNFRFNCQTACGHASAFSRRAASELCVNFRPRW